MSPHHAPPQPGPGTPHDTTVIVDGHVHLHACFRLEAWLDAADRNLARAEPAGSTGTVVRILLLTESAGARAFEQLVDRRPAFAGGWRITPTAEPLALRAIRADAGELLLVAGRQIATGAGLELLALGMIDEPPDGRPFDESLATVHEAGAVAVVPWGFGKWWGARGRHLACMLEDAGPDTLCLGDNGGRPRFAREPTLFARARERGVQIVPGSDPLPFARHERRAGDTGFTARLALDPARPIAGVMEAMRRPATVLRPFGRGPGPLGFARDQLAMQWRVRRMRRGGRIG